LRRRGDLRLRLAVSLLAQPRRRPHRRQGRAPAAARAPGRAPAAFTA